MLAVFTEMISRPETDFVIFIKINTPYDFEEELLLWASTQKKTL